MVRLGGVILGAMSRSSASALLLVVIAGRGVFLRAMSRRARPRDPPGREEHDLLRGWRDDAESDAPAACRASRFASRSATTTAACLHDFGHRGVGVGTASSIGNGEVRHVHGPRQPIADDLHLHAAFGDDVREDHLREVKWQERFSSPERKRRYVRSLFATIADRYDLITVLLSGGLDRGGNGVSFGSADRQPGTSVLDLACGTGDIAFELGRLRGSRVVGLDITPRMVELARSSRSTSAPGLVRDRRHDGAAVAGRVLRRRDDRLRASQRSRLAGALAEIHRVLRPAGCCCRSTSTGRPIASSGRLPGLPDRGRLDARRRPARRSGYVPLHSRIDPALSGRAGRVCARAEGGIRPLRTGPCSAGSWRCICAKVTFTVFREVCYHRPVKPDAVPQPAATSRNDSTSTHDNLDQFPHTKRADRLTHAAASGKAAFVLDRKTVGNVRDLVRTCANDVNLLDSLLDAIVRLDGDALVMHVGEKPYVVTTSEAREPVPRTARLGTGRAVHARPHFGRGRRHARPDPAARSAVSARGDGATEHEVDRREPSRGALHDCRRPRRRGHLDRDAAPAGAECRMRPRSSRICDDETVPVDERLPRNLRPRRVEMREVATLKGREVPRTAKCRRPRRSARWSPAGANRPEFDESPGRDPLDGAEAEVQRPRRRPYAGPAVR